MKCNSLTTTEMSIKRIVSGESEKIQPQLILKVSFLKSSPLSIITGKQLNLIQFRGRREYKDNKCRFF